jgi:hypothetical protein
METGKRILRKVIFHPSGCWVFTGTRHADGYGIITNAQGQRRVAYRVSYETFVGPIPDGLYVTHTCDRPACVNPDHLVPDTQQGNMRGCSERGRHGPVRWRRLPLEQHEAVRAATGSSRKIAERFGISKTHAQRLRK